MTRPVRYWSGDDTPTELRLAAPEIATDDADDTAGFPIDSFWAGALLVGAVFFLLGLAAMVVGLVGYFTGSR